MGEIRPTPIRHKLIDTLGDIQRGDFHRPGYFFKITAASARKDFRPNAYTYSDVFMDALFENDVPAMLERVIGPDMTLANMHIVDSVPPGYSRAWHTDNFLDEPIHKLLYYPTFGGPPEPRLEILPGHCRATKPIWLRRLLDNRPVRKWEPRLFKHQIRSVSGHDGGFLLMNTQVIHRAVEVTNERGAIRILYSFRKRFRSTTEMQRYLAVQPGTVQDIAAISAQYDARCR